MCHERNRISLTNFESMFLTNDYIDAYGNLDRSYRGIYKRSADRLIELAGIEPGSSVIDIGAGTGTSTLSAWDAMRFDGKLLAIDPSPEMLRRAAAKPELSGVNFRQGSAEDVADIAIAAGMAGRIDAVISNFTYYYTYRDRQELYRKIYSVLLPGGRWVFNLTRYLGKLKINGESYNDFAVKFERQLRAVAQQQGVQFAQEADDVEPRSFSDTQAEEELLRLAGFTTVAVEAWPLPLTPSEAYRFTIDGFYRHGSNITFAKWLMLIPLEHRIQILLDALTRCAKDIDRFPRPHIANFRALKP